MTGSPPTEPPLEPPQASTRDGDPSQLALGALVFVATLVLLLGLSSIWTRGDRGSDASPSGQTAGTSPSAPSSSASPSATPDVTSPSATIASPSASPTAEPVAVLVGAGDIGDCSTRDDTATAALLDDIEGTVFTAGDNAYENGTAEEFATCYDDTWGRHKARTRPAPGNHDWRTSGLRGYFGYFGDAAQGEDGNSWYSYDLGTWHVIVLDSECSRVGGCGPDSPQGRWLAADLAASDASCTVAIWHKPRFTSGEHGNDRSVAPFWTALYGAGVEVVINGHDHDYERFAPQDPSAREDRERGIREFVVGTGGRSLYAIPGTAQPANLVVAQADAFGVLRLTLRPEGYRWSWETAARQPAFEDESDGAVACVRAAP
jgi:hypothetical protein